MLGQTASGEIDRMRAVLLDLEHKIWDNPEKPYREFKACAWTARVLEEAGFLVEVGVGGVDTAIRATWGNGHPIIGFLGEYDALPGLSQKVSPEKEPVVQDGWGQGCGHNLLGTAHVGAVIGLKREMEELGLCGTIIFYGCPAEEILTGKVFMARDGVFDELDLSIAFHPGTTNEVTLGNAIGLNTFKLHFTGRTAHAGGDPHNGRSALDAVELTNIGINYLREHVPTDVRMHYTITDGGVAPNIVPDRASAWYYVRAPKRELVDEVYQRMLDVGRGAALMTGTQLDVEFQGGCYPTLNNAVLAGIVHEAMNETTLESYTDEEIEFAHQLNLAEGAQWHKSIKMLGLTEKEQIHSGIAPIGNIGNFGSTDVGDVQHIAPGITFTTACYNLGAPGHNWQVTACSGHTIGEKGMIFAAKTMALFGLKVLCDPGIVQKAREEFLSAMAGEKYVCPIPEEISVPNPTGTGS